MKFPAGGMMSKLNRHDYANFDYFHNRRADITEWPGWKARKPLFKEHHPELIAAMENLKLAEKTLSTIITGIFAQNFK